MALEDPSLRPTVEEAHKITNVLREGRRKELGFVLKFDGVRITKNPKGEEERQIFFHAERKT